MTETIFKILSESLKKNIIPNKNCVPKQTTDWWEKKKFKGGVIYENNILLPPHTHVPSLSNQTQTVYWHLINSLFRFSNNWGTTSNIRPVYWHLVLGIPIFNKIVTETLPRISVFNSTSLLIFSSYHLFILFRSISGPNYFNIFFFLSSYVYLCFSILQKNFDICT